MALIEGSKVALTVPGVSTSGGVKSGASPPVAKAPEGASFGQVLRAMGEEARRGEALVERAVHAGAAGREISPAELIALQAGVYRWVEVVDLASKLVDRATQAAKTVTQPSGG
ncbi:MAG: hypothetical protein HYV09_37810 [Deltaproteobacteria bacterium]|nr:hypothetical protein [Deltaproteobacteria bacterium]